MSAISKILVTTGIAAAVGFAGYVGMQRATVAAFDSIEKSYQQVVVSNPALVSPEDAKTWLATNTVAINAAQSSQGLRKVGVWLAVPGTRKDIAALNADLNHMVEMRVAHMAAVEKRMGANADVADNDWIKLLPPKVQSQVSNATRTIAWLKEDSKTHAAFQEMSKEFAAKSELMEAKLKRPNSSVDPELTPEAKTPPVPVAPAAQQPMGSEPEDAAKVEHAELMAKK